MGRKENTRVILGYGNNVNTKWTILRFKAAEDK